MKKLLVFLIALALSGCGSLLQTTPGVNWEATAKAAQAQLQAQEGEPNPLDAFGNLPTAAPTQESSAGATPEPVDQQVMGSPNVCLVPFEPNSEAGTEPDWLWRLEIGGNQIQHRDFYPRTWQSVSYLVPLLVEPGQVQAIWYGFGSPWQANPAGCHPVWLEVGDDGVTRMNMRMVIADTSRYAWDRVDSGHSGLVVNLTDLTIDQVKELTLPMLMDRVVYNHLNLPEAEIEKDLTGHLWYMRDLFRLGLVSEEGFLTTDGMEQAPIGEAGGAGCSGEEMRSLDWEPGKQYELLSDPISFEPFSSDSRMPDGRIVVVFPAETSIVLPSWVEGGGAYTYPGCSYEQAQAQSNWDGKLIYHVEGDALVPGPFPTDG